MLQDRNLFNVLGLIALASAFGSNLLAATWSAADASAGAVQAAINSAADGDTVQVPSGSVSWSGPISITKGISLIGAGIGNTVISGIPLVRATVPFGKSLRIRGFTFIGNSSVITYIISVTGGSKLFRMDHCNISGGPNGYYAVESRDMCGVIDHCVFGQNGAGIIAFHEAWNGASFGDGSWADDHWMGTTNALYIEDCHFAGSGRNGAIDSGAGAHLAFRHNIVANDILVGHGADSGGRRRSTRAIEIYNNILNASGSYAENELRGGTACIFSNTLSGTFQTVYILKQYRLAGGQGGWPGDPNRYDGNTDGFGYPCLDQCGRGKGNLTSGNPMVPVAWPNQQLEPVYAWANTLNGAPAGIVSGGSINGISLGSVIVAGRDYFNGTPRPGYTPLVYPHPMISALSPQAGGGSRN